MKQTAPCLMRCSDCPQQFSFEHDAYLLTLPAPADWTGADFFFFPEPEGLITPAGVQTVSVEDGVLTSLHGARMG